MIALSGLLALLEGGSADVGKVTITAGELKDGLAALRSFPLDDLQEAVAARLSNVPADFVVAEDFVTLLGELGLPDAAMAVLALKALAWIVANNRSADPGALTRIAGGKRGS